jgi:flagella basal body P-ring formation protein FlgA
MYAGFQTKGARADMPLVSPAAASDLNPLVRRGRPRG